MENLRIQIRPESSILAKYKEIDYKIESVLSEFIDNSTQSYFDHKSDLNNLGIKTCRIEIDIFSDEIRISDNAYGMNELDFRRALKLDSPPEDRSGRNERGMGLKTAATFLGAVWSVKTTEYGSAKLYSAEMDVDYIQQNAPEEIEAQVSETSVEDHYTEIRIRNLNQKITPKKVSKVISTLAEMYARDIKNGDASISINKTPLKYEVPEIRLDENGNEYLKQICRTFSYDEIEYEYSGWVGIRKTGSTSSAGLTLLHKGRAVVTNYRPKDLFGGPNSYPYQRIIGELDMGENWPISHTKDAFLWDGGLESAFIDALKVKSENGIGDLISIATKLRKEDSVKEEQLKIIKKTEKTFKGLKDVKITEEIIKAEPKVEKTYTSEITSKPSEQVIHIDFQGKGYDFEIVEERSIGKDWISIEKTTIENYYVIKVDYDIPYFHGLFETNAKSKTSNYVFVEKMVVSLALAYVTSKSSGCRDGHILINMLNSIISNTQ